MAGEPDFTRRREWGQNGTLGGPLGSYEKRFAPLLHRQARYLAAAFPLPAGLTVEDLVQGFLLKAAEAYCPLEEALKRMHEDPQELAAALADLDRPPAAPHLRQTVEQACLLLHRPEYSDDVKRAALAKAGAPAIFDRLDYRHGNLRALTRTAFERHYKDEWEKARRRDRDRAGPELEGLPAPRSDEATFEANDLCQQAEALIDEYLPVGKETRQFFDLFRAALLGDQLPDRELYEKLGWGKTKGKAVKTRMLEQLRVVRREQLRREGLQGEDLEAEEARCFELLKTKDRQRPRA